MKNIILIGPMGAGKTTIGKQLSRRLGREFFDSDHEIEKRTGADIPLIFEIESEEGFRKREAQVISDILKFENIVLSTGGGVVLSEENRRLLIENGYIVYLKSSPEQLYKRTMNDKRRPLLQGGNKFEQIKKILSERETFYLSLANLVIETDHMHVKQIIKNIMNNIEQNDENDKR